MEMVAKEVGETTRARTDEMEKKGRHLTEGHPVDEGGKRGKYFGCGSPGMKKKKKGRRERTAGRGARGVAYTREDHRQLPIPKAARKGRGQTEIA